ncbi:hypothetical protein HF670_01310 [Acidithiobacillus thiooxidans]|uniref:hypothetical protein n=1 Tax=Acidithiobacillus thiooxidans TaxID=930 RepID=UPI001C0692A9|nr:hypothetical protein [Acidithiobacillus thiooxidans]MBU2838226.1 hypothetical protein [Acidithiobacillus thiooxidans]
MSPKGEFSPDSRMSLRTTGKEQWSKKHPRQLPFLDLSDVKNPEKIPRVHQHN